MSLDFSNIPDLAPLSRTIRALQAVAQPLNIDCFLMGATARDPMTHYAHGITIVRATQDVDLAVTVKDWRAYETLRVALITSGEFASSPTAAHRFRHIKSGLPLDIVPFGGVERADRTVAWPPDGNPVFDCFGMREASATTIHVELPEGVSTRAPAIPTLVILKIVAWQDRKQTHPGRDARDLLLYFRHYMDCGNLDRASAEHGDLFEADDFDYVEAGVRLLARDVAALLDHPATERLLTTLVPETDENGPLLLAQQSGGDLEGVRRLLEVFCDELAANL